MKTPAKSPTVDVEAHLGFVDRYREQINASLKSSGKGITIVAGPVLAEQTRLMLLALGWRGTPIHRISQSHASRIADTQLDVERRTGQAPDPIFIRWLHDRHADRVWVFTEAANFLFRSNGTQLVLVPGSTDQERAAMGLAPYTATATALFAQILDGNTRVSAINAKGGLS